MSKDAGLGLAFAFVAIAFFGSNFVVTKKYPTGDGMFFQWVLCAGIWSVGLVLWLARDPTSHIFEPWACLGGVLWCTGNIWTVPIIQCIGLGLGLVIWGSANMLMGWASGKFGLFGLTAQVVKHPTMNVIGVLISICALFLFMFVKPEDGNAKKEKPGQLMLDVNGDVDDMEAYGKTEEKAEGGSGFINKMSPASRRIFGVVMSLIAGVLYGTNFDPPQYINDYPTKHAFVMEYHINGTNTTVNIPAPGNLVDYAFPHFCGIFFTSTLYFMVYCAFQKNKPVVYPEICLPGFISGILWAIAQCSWFVANGNLSFPVSFPLVSVGPGLVGSLWGVFVYKEIRGKKNFLILGAAFAVSITASTIIALSN